MDTKEIYEKMRELQPELPYLAGLDPAIEYDDYITAVSSDSNVADHSHWVYQFAYFAYLQRQQWGDKLLEMQMVADSLEPGTSAWWRRVVEEFQIFDELVVVSGRTTYTVIDESKRIVRRNAITVDEASTVLIKVAKEDSPGILQPLDSSATNDELGSLEAYLKFRQPLGTKLRVVSVTADKLQVQGTIYYNRALGVTTVRESVQAAMDGYIEAFSLDESRFDGAVSVLELTDAIQDARGVEDLSPLRLTGIAGGVTVTTDRVYDTKSGYVIEDADNPFMFTLKFEPHD